MVIVRVPEVSNYTIMSNYHLTDPNLSLKAKGIMSYMLSRPDNWDFTIEGLACQNKEGSDAIVRIIRELKAQGYITRSRTRNQAGKFTDMEYNILECPMEAAKKKNRKSLIIIEQHSLSVVTQGLLPPAPLTRISQEPRSEST